MSTARSSRLDRRIHRRLRLAEPLEKVVIDVGEAHLWDITAVGGTGQGGAKYRRHGVTVEVIGLNEASAHMLDRFAVHDKSEARRSPQHTEFTRPRVG